MIIAGHEIITDLATLIKAGYEIPQAEFFCTSTAARFVWPDQIDFTLEHLALRCTNLGQWRQTLGKLEIEDFDAMSDEDLGRRCAGDAEAPVRLAKILDAEITAYGLRKVWNLAMSVLPILAEVGGKGM